MSSESGGAPARRGFNFQDYAAAHYFLQFSNTHEIHIERYEDFSLFSYQDDYQVKRFFEAKSQIDGQFTKANFKNKVADNFADITRTHNDEETIIRLHLVTNVKTNRTLRDLFEDVEALRSDAMQWHTFESQHDREFIQPLRDETGLTEENLQAFLSGLNHNFHSKDELELKIKDYLRECNLGEYRKGARKMLQLIHETDSGTITRGDIEDKVGFSLKKRDDSTNAPTSYEDLEDEIQNFKTKHQDASVDVDSPIKEKETTKLFLSATEPTNDINSKVVEARSTRINERLEELEEIRSQERSIHSDLAQEYESLLDVDDSTSSERGNKDD